MRGRFLRLILSGLLVFLVVLTACTMTPTPTPAPAPTPTPTIPKVSLPPKDDLCGNPECQVEKVILNTGYNQATGALYQPVTPDGYWELVNSPDSGITVPTPAWVIHPHSDWETLPDSQWISAYEYPGWTTNNHAPSAAYSFQRGFCTCKGVNSIEIDLTLLVDNAAWVYFDGILIGEQPVDTTTSFHLPGKHITYQAKNIQPGNHYLRVDVRNLNGTAMGLDIVGTVTSTDPPGASLFLKYT